MPLLLTLVVITVPLAHAQMTLDITKAAGDKPYGGERLGTILIVPKDHVVWITANMSAPPPDGKVYEGWFVDDGGSGYKTQSRRVCQKRYFYTQRTDGQSIHLHSIHRNRRTI